MNISGPQYSYGLKARLAAQGVNTSGNIELGTASRSYDYPVAPDIAYSLALQIADGDTLTMDFATGIVTGTGAGANQVETATAAGTIIADGNASVTITSALIDVGPLVFAVAVVGTDSPATWANKVRAALMSSGVVTYYTVGGSGADIVLTARVKAANDDTLNIALANGTCTGITAAPTSANTTAGVATSMAYRISGAEWDAVDAEGIALPAATKLYGVLLRGESETGNCNLEISTLAGEMIEVTPLILPRLFPNGNNPWLASPVSFSADGGDVLLYLDVHAGT